MERLTASHQHPCQSVFMYLNMPSNPILARHYSAPPEVSLHSEEIERLLKAAPTPASAEPVALSARNRLRAQIAQIEMDGLMAEVRLRIGDQELISVITRSSAQRLGLKVGDEVFAVVKATEVMIGKQGLEL